MEEHPLASLNQERLSTDSISGLGDDRPSLRVRSKPILTRRRLLMLIAIVITLGISGGATYLVFWVIRYFWRMIFNPHWKLSASENTDMKSYYGEHIPQFDVVASVFVRVGKKLPNIDNQSILENDSKGISAFADWQSLYSQVVFSQISLNSSDQTFEKTIDLPIPHDVLSQFYEPLTFFPEIVNTFVIIPSHPDPMLDLPNPSEVFMEKLEKWATVDQTSAPTSWTKHSLSQLSRPIDFLSDYPHGGSRLEDTTRSLNLFYNSGAVKEFALRPVIDDKAIWGGILMPYGYTDPLDQARQKDDLARQKEHYLMEWEWLKFRRNSSLKIKTRSWLSMDRETPRYDFEEYYFKRHGVVLKPRDIRHDPLNRWFSFFRPPFKTIGHYQSYITQLTEEADPSEVKVHPGREANYFYGPYMTLRDHAAGSEDWITLPRVNESSNNPSDPLVIPWNITFDLLSRKGIIAVDTINENNPEWYYHYEDDRSVTNNIYQEANLLQTMDFINAVFGNNHTYSKRPVLRSIFFFIGGVIRYLLGSILQTYYLFSRSLSTGLSLPPIILYLCFSSLYRVFYYCLYRNDTPTSAWTVGAVLTVNIVSICRWACLWWGIGFTWNDWGSSAPVKFRRFGQTHSERLSRRLDQKFTWAQRGLFVIISTIVLGRLPRLPHIITSTYLRDPHVFYFDHGPSAPLETVSIWSKESGIVEFTDSFLTSLSMMAVLAQVLLNWRSGTFAGSVPAFAWTQVVGTILLWVPTILHSVFGKFHVTDPLKISVVVQFCIDLVILWQAVSLPAVDQED